MIHRNSSVEFTWKDAPIWKIWHYWLPVRKKWWRPGNPDILIRDIVEREFQWRVFRRDVKFALRVPQFQQAVAYTLASLLIHIGYKVEEMIPLISLAIARGNSASNNENPATTPVDVTLDAGTGSNRFLAVGSYVNSTRDNMAATYNSVSATNVNSVAFTTDRKVFSFQLAAPATGSNTLSLSWTGGGGGDTYASGVVYTDVHQTTPVVANTTTDSAVADNTTTLDEATANCWLFATHRNDVDGDGVAGAGSTLVTSQDGIGGTYDSNGTVATGSVSMTVTHTSGNSGQCMFKFQPAPAAVSIRLLTLTGVGT